MIPAVAIAQERDPLAVGGWQRARFGAAGNAPEFLVHIFVHRLRLVAGNRRDRNRALLVVGRLAIEHEVCRVEPAPPTGPAANRDGCWPAGLRLARAW